MLFAFKTKVVSISFAPDHFIANRFIFHLYCSRSIPFHTIFCRQFQLIITIQMRNKHETKLPYYTIIAVHITYDFVRCVDTTVRRHILYIVFALTLLPNAFFSFVSFNKYETKYVNCCNAKTTSSSSDLACEAQDDTKRTNGKNLCKCYLSSSHSSTSLSEYISICSAKQCSHSYDFAAIGLSLHNLFSFFMCSCLLSNANSIRICFFLFKITTVTSTARGKYKIDDASTA